MIAGGIIWWKQARVNPKPPEPTPVTTDKDTSKKGDVGNDICAEFSVDFVYSAIKKPIIRVEVPIAKY